MTIASNSIKEKETQNIQDSLFKNTLPTLKQNSINLVELLLLFAVTLLWGSRDSRASYSSNKKGNSFMSQHSSISSVTRVFAFNKVQSVKPFRGMHIVNVSFACTFLIHNWYIQIGARALKVVYALCPIGACSMS